MFQDQDSLSYITYLLLQKQTCWWTLNVGIEKISLEFPPNLFDCPSQLICFDSFDIVYLYDSRLEIRQKFYTNGFLGQKFYTEKNLSIVTIFANEKTAQLSIKK